MLAEPFYDVPEGEDYLALYETIDRKRQEAKDFKVSLSISKASLRTSMLL